MNSVTRAVQSPEEVVPAMQSDTRLTTLDEVANPLVPDGAGVMTVLVEIPPGSRGTPPHRHSGPVFGYLTEGRMTFELEGEPPRLIDPGQAFSEPGARSCIGRPPTPSTTAGLDLLLSWSAHQVCQC